MPNHAEAQNMRAFTTIWFGQLISLIGSGLTSFVLGVLVFQHTGSVTLFSLIALSGIVPSIILSPVAGALVDRWDRRWVMIMSDACSALNTFIIALLLLFGQLAIWYIYVATIANAIASTFQRPAYAASTTLLVPQEQLGRANGMTQMALAASQLVSPVLAGVLIAFIQIKGVVFIDFATFLVSLLTLLLVRVPRLQKGLQGEEPQSSLISEITYGWKYLMAQAGLRALMLFFAVGNILIGYVSVLATPLVLHFTSPAVLGTVLSIGGSGMLISAVGMSSLGGPKRRIYAVLGSSLLCGFCLILTGLRPSALLITIAAFGVFFSLPITNGSTTAIIQSKVAPELQGRILAVAQMLAGISLPIAYLTAGPLADRVFEPLLAVRGPLSASVGQLIGVGSGRGIGLFFIVLGSLMVVLVAIGCLYPRLRRVEDELPDAISTKFDQPIEDIEPHWIRGRSVESE